jgi:organic radical activating enzyme
MGRQGASVSEIFVSVQGEGRYVGCRHLFVRLAGCPLRCRYCDSPESLVPVPACHVAWGDGREELRPTPLSVSALDEIVATRAATEPRLHALAVTGGEPLAQASFLAEWLPQRSTRVPVLLETAATLPERLAQVLPWVDIVSADIKLPSNSGEPPRWAEHAACLRAAAGCEVYVKVLIDEDTDPEEIARAVRLVAEIDRDIPVFLQPITNPVDGRLCLRPQTLERFYRHVAGLGVEIRVVPQVHKTLGVP